ncbi:uncharacterized protein LOC134275294 [Saccostrea cucullata]|uniref:uncharacterized protein LOC134275294 n=1 Tax=Saccostrea cuccullata TaxID=36930 RepID=UPI002ED5B9F0
MTDIQAISQMKARRKCHADVKIPNSSDQFDTFQEEIVKASKVTSDVIQQVNNYVRRIQEEMTELRRAIELFNTDLAGQMKTLISKLIASNPLQSNQNQVFPSTSSSDFDSKPTQRGITRNPTNKSAGLRASDNVSSYQENTQEVSRTESESLKQLKALQEISKQQLDLRKMMLEVDNISKDLERNGHVSVEGLIALKQDVDQ